MLLTMCFPPLPAAVCRTVGMSMWRQDRVAGALTWFLRANDTQRAELALKPLVERVEQAVKDCCIAGGSYTCVAQICCSHPSCVYSMTWFVSCGVSHAAADQALSAVVTQVLCWCPHGGFVIESDATVLFVFSRFFHLAGAPVEDLSAFEGILYTLAQSQAGAPWPHGVTSFLSLFLELQQAMRRLAALGAAGDSSQVGP